MLALPALVIASVFFALAIPFLCHGRAKRAGRDPGVWALIGFLWASTWGGAVGFGVVFLGAPAWGLLQDGNLWGLAFAAALLLVVAGEFFPLALIRPVRRYSRRSGRGAIRRSSSRL